jgi:hypothetical protein
VDFVLCLVAFPSFALQPAFGADTISRSQNMSNARFPNCDAGRSVLHMLIVRRGLCTCGNRILGADVMATTNRLKIIVDRVLRWFALPQ